MSGGEIFNAQRHAGMVGKGVTGAGTIQPDGTGGFHNTMQISDGRVSWPTDALGRVVGDTHFTDVAAKIGTPARHPFGK